MPPLTGVAVKVTDAPLHTDAVVGVMLTVGITVFTVTTASLDVAVAGCAHGSDDVINTDT